MVAFNQIPSGLLIPFVAVEFDTSAAQQGPALLTYNGLIIGQKLAAGSWAADTLVKVSSLDQVLAGSGRGSMLHRQYLAWRASNKTTPLWMGVLADNAGGVAAVGSILVAGPATAAGTVALYLGGERITIGVNSGDASTAIATAIGAAINANLDLPVTATVAASTVTITFRHKGLVGNTYDVRANFRDGEALPAGVTLTVTAVGAGTPGTTNPTVTNLIAAMVSMWFQIWTHPYTDATTLTALEAELAARGGPMRQQQALAVTSASGTFSTLTSLGAGRNSPNSSIWSQTGKVPLTPPMEFAAEVAAVIALAGQADPGRPLQTLALSRALACAETDQWDPLTEQNTMLGSGISTTVRVAGGGVALQRGVTTYETSPSGAADTSYRDIPTLLTLLYLRFAFRTRIQLKYPRHKLGDDGVRYGSGQAMITPKLGKAEAVGWFEDMIDLALVENIDQFKRDLVCVRNVSNRNQLDWLLPPDLINQLIVAAAQIQYRL
jgi:phage tail sheath gpL-like